MLSPPDDSQQRQKLKAPLPQMALAHFQFWHNAHPAPLTSPTVPMRTVFFHSLRAAS